MYHCLIVEELWDVLKKFKSPTVNFRTLNSLTIQRVKLLVPELF